MTVSKTIAISEELYDLLKERKLIGESFNDVIARHLAGIRTASKYVGGWSDLSAAEEYELGMSSKMLRENFLRPRFKMERW